jgi:hypothetical protein
MNYEEALAWDRTKAEVLLEERDIDIIEVFSDEFEADPNQCVRYCIEEIHRRMT